MRYLQWGFSRALVGAWVLCSGVVLAACSSDSHATSSAPVSTPEAGVPVTPPVTTVPDDAGAVVDSGTPVDAAPDAAIDTSAMVPCPTTGEFAFTATGATCFNFTPADAGASASGENATLPHYAVRPTASAPTALVLFFIGSGGKPSGVVKAGADTNLYAAAAQDGQASLGLAYKNIQSIGSICQQNDACFFPTRQSVVLGVNEPGSGITMTLDEGIVDRTARALRYLAQGDPTGGWSSFLTTLDPTADPSTAIAWSKIIAAGHSQGGGHADVIGKLFPVLRVVQFSSVCDRSGTMPASWTDGSVGTWATDPALFFGFAAPSTFNPDGTITGDQTCPYHASNWANLGMRPARQDDAAAVCGDTGDTHSESIRCPDNYQDWVRLFR